MSTILEVYDAFKAAGVPEEQAKKASEAVANRDDTRLTAIEQRLTNVEGRLIDLEKDSYLVKWMLGFVLAMQLAILLKLFL